MVLLTVVVELGPIVVAIAVVVAIDTVAVVHCTMKGSSKFMNSSASKT